MQRAVALLLLFTAACRAPYDKPNSICDLPRGARGWSGTEVRWKGAMVGTFQHGFALVTEECARRGMSLGSWDSAELDQALRAKSKEPGVLRVDVSAKIVGERPRLRITEVHRISFQPLSYEQEEAYWRSKGF